MAGGGEVPGSVSVSISDLIPLRIFATEDFITSTTLVRVPIVREATTVG